MWTHIKKQKINFSFPGDSNIKGVTIKTLNMKKRLFIILPISLSLIITSLTVIIPLLYWIITGKDYIVVGMNWIKSLNNNY